MKIFQKPVQAVLLFAAFFTLLFHKHPPGLNLLIFEFLFILQLLLSKQIRLRTTAGIISFSGFIVTGIFTFLTYSLFIYTIHFLSALIFIGMLIDPHLRSFVHAIGISINAAFMSQKEFWKNIFHTNNKSSGILKFIMKSRYFILPFIIILVFIFIYRKSNPVFNQLLISISDAISEFLNFLFKDIDLTLLITFIFGTLISSFLIIRQHHTRLSLKEKFLTDDLHRKRNNAARRQKISVFKNIYKSGIFLFLILNSILLILNFIDIYWVWFNFQWNGQYLKQFVHEGTYLLIISILLSIALVLFYFKGNFSFYSKNNTLKYLAYAWIFQNVILAFSVGIRNYHYITYYNLAYKRIGVIIFLILVIFGLISALIKVRKRKSAFYLLRINAFAVYIILVLSSTVNWDTCIAKYNFSRYETSYIHFDFLASLSDKALPWLDKSKQELEVIDNSMQKLFPPVSVYMNSESYFNIIERRKSMFKQDWEKKHWISWNFQEYRAYRKLFKNK